MYQYKVAKVIEVIDGDTVDLLIDLGCNVFIKERIRLSGIDTPELRSSDPDERVRARRYKEWLIDRLDKKQGYTLMIETRKDRKGKYGRLLGVLYYVRDEDLPVNTRFGGTINEEIRDLLEVD